MNPILLAMIPCERVVRDGGRLDLIGVRRRIECDGFPSELASFMVYLAMTGFHSPGECKLRWGPVDLNDQGFVQRGPIQLASPLDVHESFYDLSGWPLTQPGWWNLDLFWNGELLVTRRVELCRRRPAP